MMTRAEKRLAKIEEARVDKAFRRSCCNVPINVMDIGKVFDFGRLKIAQGETDAELESSLRAYVETIRV